MNPPRAGDIGFQTPVALLIFNRPETTARVFAEVRRARPSRLLVVADGARPGVEGEAELCALAREATEDVDWPCDVSRDYSSENRGCRDRVSTGIDWVFDQVEEAIFLEDDCLPDPSFFSYCKELLDRYRDNDRVMHIGGDNLHFGVRGTASYFFSRYPHVWGWASWRRAWRRYDVALAEWASAEDQDRFLAPFETEDERRFWRQTWDSIRRGQLDTWDYQWVFACVENDGLAINPNANLVANIGFGEASTNTATDESGIANIQPAAIELPLRHPASLERDRECDAETARRFFSSPAAASAALESRSLLEKASAWLSRSR